METRLDSFADIAEKEGLPKTAAREQMYEMLKDGEASRLFLQYGDEERVWTILNGKGWPTVQTDSALIGLLLSS